MQVQHRPSNGAFNSLFDHLLNDFSMPLLNADTTHGKAPVNITKGAEGYTLDMAVPGFEKEAISIQYDKGQLTVKAEASESTESKEGDKVLRHEFRRQTVSRSFHVDETIDGNAISAKYVNGVLTLNLPLKAEVKAPAKQITIE